VDGYSLGEPGPVTRELQAAYARVVRGQEPAYEAWLDRV
jgi:hypothetical protein